MSARKSILSLGLAVMFLPFLCGGGCVVTIDPVNGGDGDNNGGNGGSTDTTITIRIINATNVTLDPEIYVSAEPVNLEDLFRTGNKYTAFGVGTLGLLGGGDTDQFTVQCANARVIGTKGGKFGDDLNNPDGTGRQIVLTQDLSVFCGGRVTLTYSRSGDGFNTTYDVDP